MKQKPKGQKLMMEEAEASETSVYFYQYTRRHTWDGSNRHSRRHHNLEF